MRTKGELESNRSIEKEKSREEAEVTSIVRDADDPDDRSIIFYDASVLFPFPFPTRSSDRRRCTSATVQKGALVT